MVSAVWWAMTDIRKGKAAESDGVTIQMLGEVRDMAITNILEIGNKIYHSGQISEHICTSVFIAILLLPS